MHIYFALLVVLFLLMRKRHYVYTTKQTQSMNLALKLGFDRQQQSVFRPLRLAEDYVSCSEYYNICKYTTRTNVPENDCTETEQCHQLGDHLRKKDISCSVNMAGVSIANWSSSEGLSGHANRRDSRLCI